MVAKFCILTGWTGADHTPVVSATPSGFCNSALPDFTGPHSTEPSRKDFLPMQSEFVLTPTSVSMDAPMARTRGSWCARALALLFSLGLASAASAQARTLTVLHTFGNINDGADPQAGLIRDSAGNFYGVTSGGGTHNLGTVFKLDSSGVETVLYSFSGGSDGRYPIGGLIRDGAGNLYGTTIGGAPGGPGFG